MIFQPAQVPDGGCPVVDAAEDKSQPEENLRGVLPR